MHAISAKMRIIYACNLGKGGPNMPAMTSDRIGSESHLINCYCSHIWSPSDTIAGIYGPYRN